MEIPTLTADLTAEEKLFAQNLEVQRVFMALVEAFKLELSKHEKSEVYKTWIAVKDSNEDDTLNEFGAYLFHLAIDENELGEYRIEFCFDDSIIQKAGLQFHNSLLRHFFMLSSTIACQTSYDPTAYDVHSFFLSRLENGEDELTIIGRS